MWVASDIYHQYNKPAEVVVPENISAKLNPVLDQDTIDQIVSSLFLDDSQIPDQVANPETGNNNVLITETVLPTPLPTASSSAEL